ncbi:HypC/HybG/HupF family hydrogenase formation chaperone [Methylocystis echinoides]|uniref:Hydrogenase assembly protein HypC n=1 Tax=Methylocystis echinoides TaxID=29468 RepID=A0A9W6LS96_9HYPH|nr:HypC/HybG/HupF family hydrogenase formation chaperone [Methylocystis echinoides]GLI93440.1 hydrogenase assembly protein HypC [Methylocystis echinoides]
MCLAVPMQIDEISGLEAKCSAKGVTRTVSLFMVRDRNPGVGDWVLVHVGYAIEKIFEKEAKETWELFDQMLRED